MTAGSPAATTEKMCQVFADYFKCAPEFADFRLFGELAAGKQFFGFGPDVIGYGRLASRQIVNHQADSVEDMLDSVRMEGKACYFPFDPDEVVNNLRLERYYSPIHANSDDSSGRKFIRTAYYAARPFLPVLIRKYLQRAALRGWDRKPFPRWPVDHTVDSILARMLILALQANQVDSIPFIWFWPDGKSACATMTHDVETAQGRDFCSTLMDLNDSFGVKASFQLVPEQRYCLPDRLLQRIRERGFEINVHDLNHDGNLFRDRSEFLCRAAKINEYARKFGAAGYRSGVLYRNLDWYEAFDFSYDMSVPNVGHLDPQHGGCCTTKPYFVGKILEIPVTTTQDYTLFHILQEYSTDLWEQQIEIILSQHGLASFIVHPDYVIEERARETYASLLARLAQLRQESNVWIALPGEVNDWWRMRHEMRLVCERGNWTIEGRGKERARVAFAGAIGDQIVYCSGPSSCGRTFPASQWQP